MRVLITMEGAEVYFDIDLPIIPNVGDAIDVGALIEAHGVPDPIKYDTYESDQMVTERWWSFERDEKTGAVIPRVHLLLFANKPEEMPQERWDQLSYVLA